MTGENQIGIVGLSTMGANLAMNFADQGFSVAAYNRSPEKTQVLKNGYTGKGSIDPQGTLKTFVESLEIPRKIILMVKAGEAIDQVMTDILPLLDRHDIVIDGGNSHFRDTIRRERSAAEHGIVFVGMGISGGEEGARRGPSLMPGGSVGGYIELMPFLERIAAKDFDGKPCVTHIGENGAGHYVKMVHNGIEYADMELIAETYWILKQGFSMTNEEIADLFTEWNAGKSDSYLMEITAKILRTKTEEGDFVVDRILDRADSKGTGKWAAEESLELGLPGFTLISSVLARSASKEKTDREKYAVAFPKRMNSRTPLPTQMFERALIAGRILAYAEGFALLAQAEKTYGWTFDYAEIARIWQGGCIIRSALLKNVETAFREDPSPFLLMPFTQTELTENVPALRAVTIEALRDGIPVPTLTSALSAFDSLTSEKLPANLIQAQRDFFGAHGFQIEKDGDPLHFDWRK